MIFRPGILAALFGLMLAPAANISFAQDLKADSDRTPVPPVANPCPRFSAGSRIHDPPALFSSEGVLKVRFSYQQRIDSNGLELLCFMTPEGLEDPTLHVKPGDHLMITLTNNTPSAPAFMEPLNDPICGSSRQPTRASINIHYHGTNTSPSCHQDNVIKTVINPGETFEYDVVIPSNEPPGLFFYHPHIHMLAEASTQAGATGAIIVEGMEGQQPAARGLKQRVLLVRDQLVPGFPSPIGHVPSFDLSLNYIPITSSASSSSGFVSPILPMQPASKEFWRLANIAADVVLDIQYLFDGAPQTLQLVAIDGVPVNSQDGAGPGRPIAVTHFNLPTASRAEFIVSAPPSSVRVAQLITRAVNGGPIAIVSDPQRPLATVQLSEADEEAESAEVNGAAAAGTMSATQKRFAGLGSAPVAVKRTVFFDENVTTSPPQFFMAVQGKPEHLFDPNAVPDIMATQGTVEEWTVENRTGEIHEFHIHQIHFLVESQNNFEINGSAPTPAINGQYLDTVHVPFWDQHMNHPFPSVTLRLDFRGNDIGDFVFHCHILAHEDLGMMSIIRVVAPQAAGAGASKVKLAAKTSSSNSKGGAAKSADSPASATGAMEMATR
jgi:FtsP/CotA-like multicopper oxidase with cupredoxin domain